jgi:hypothetical protein
MRKRTATLLTLALLGVISGASASSVSMEFAQEEQHFALSSIEDMVQHVYENPYGLDKYSDQIKSRILGSDPGKITNDMFVKMLWAHHCSCFANVDRMTTSRMNSESSVICSMLVLRPELINILVDMFIGTPPGKSDINELRFFVLSVLNCSVTTTPIAAILINDFIGRMGEIVVNDNSIISNRFNELKKQVYYAMHSSGH